MAINVLQCLLLLALAFHCPPLYARTTPGDYEDQFSSPHDYQTGLEFSHTPVFFDTDRWNTQSDMPSLDQYYSTSHGNEDGNGWDPIQENALPFSTETEQQYSMFASPDQSELPDADSARTPEDDISSDGTRGVELSTHQDVAYEDDEVYFDTSDADTIYKAPDDE